MVQAQDVQMMKEFIEGVFRKLGRDVTLTDDQVLAYFEDDADFEACVQDLKSEET